MRMADLPSWLTYELNSETSEGLVYGTPKNNNVTAALLVKFKFYLRHYSLRKFSIFQGDRSK